MLFPTSTFAIFFLIVLPLSWLTMPKVHRWRPFIIVASYVFYAWWDWRFVFLRPTTKRRWGANEGMDRLG